MASSALEIAKELLKHPATAYRVLLYVKDPAGKWIPFSDETEALGTNRLARYGQIALQTESRSGAGTVVATTSGVDLRNEDAFFDEPFPSRLKALDGTSHSFAKTKNYSRSILYNRPFQFRLQVSYPGGSEIELPLGTFLGGEMSESPDSGIVSVRLENYALPLRLKDTAEKVKNGLDWYADRPISFLLRELLSRYNSSGTLPSGFNVPTKIRIETKASRNGDPGDPRRVSAFGRLPQYDGTTWFDSSKVVRALLWAPRDLNVSPQTPDVIYYGADDELWWFDPVTEQDTKLDDSTLGAGYKIRKLFWKQGTAEIWGIAFQDRPATGRVVTAKLFKWSGFPTPSLSVQATITDFYSGLWCYRDGRLSGGVIVGNYAVDGAGENVPLPFDQRVYFAEYTSSAWSKRTSSLQDTISSWDEARVPSFYNQGYYTFANGDTGFAPPAGLCFTLGQRGFFLFLDNVGAFGGSKGSFVYASYDASSEKIAIRAYDLDNIASGWTTLVGDLYANVSGERLDPLCGATDGTDVWVAGIYWNDGGVTNSVVAIRKISNIGGTPTNTRIYYSEDYPSDRWRTPLEMIYDGSDTGKELKVSMFDRKKLGRQDAYLYGWKDPSSSGDITQIGDSYPSPAVGMVTGDEGGDVLMFRSGFGGLWKHEKSSNLLKPVDGGFSAVENEAGLSAGLLLETSTNSSFSSYSGIAYGVTRPSPLEPDAYDAQPVGKYKLFKLDRYLTDRIELADFSGLSAWDAIGKLAQVANHLTGFDRAGNFFFVPRTLASTPVITIDNTEGAELKGRMVLSTGEKEVINVIKVTPYASSIDPPTVSLVLRPRNEEDEKSFTGEVVASQHDNLKKRIELQCVLGGKVSKPPGVWWRWRSYDEKFETRLRSAYTSGSSTIQVTSGADKVSAGDTLKITDGTNTETAVLVKTPTPSEIETGTLTLTSGLSNSYTVDGASVEITKVRSKWSDQFSSILQNSYFLDWTAGVPDGWSYGGTGTLAQDTTIFLFGDRSLKFTAGATDDTISATIAASSLKGDTWYTFSVYAQALKGDNVNAASTARILVSGADLQTIEYDKQETTVAGQWVHLVARFKTKSSVTAAAQVSLVSRVNGQPVWFDGATLVEGTRAVNPFIVVGQYDEFIPIGDTQVDLKFTDPNGGATPTSENEDKEIPFVTGDRLVVESEGLMLKKQESGTYTAIDMTSVGKYGRNELAIDNKYLNRVLASEIAEFLLSEFAYPVFTSTVEIPLSPWIDFVDSSGTAASRVDIRDTRVFQARGGGKESFFIRSIRDDPRSRRTVLTLRASTPY